MINLASAARKGNDVDVLYDFGSEFSQTYKAKCNKCGKEIEVSTQQDRCPEYYTDVFVRCQCGESVHFVLPVN